VVTGTGGMWWGGGISIHGDTQSSGQGAGSLPAAATQRFRDKATQMQMLLPEVEWPGRGLQPPFQQPF